MKIIKKYSSLLLVFVLFGQEDINSLQSNSETSGVVGTVDINGKLYNQLSVRPTIPIGKLGIGLDLYVYFNEDGLYSDSWNFSSISNSYRSIIDKIYFLRWGKPKDDLYIKVGALSNVTLGSGILVDNYSNIIEYPQNRQIGFNLSAKLNNLNFELIHSNFKKISPGIIGIRASVKVLPKLALGMSYVTDLDQNSGLKDSDGDNYPDYYDFYPNDANKYDDSIYWRNIYEEILKDDFVGKNFVDWYQNSDYYNHYNPSSVIKDPVSGFSIDIAYNLSNKISLYSQIAKLIGEIDTSLIDPLISLDNNKLGLGIVPIGLRTKLGPLNLLAEYRLNSRYFVFNYWDKTYDVNRVTLDGLSNLITKESSLYQYGSLSGFYIQSYMNIINLFDLGFGYQNLFGEIWDVDLRDYKSKESNQTFFSTFTVNPSLIPKVKTLDAYYQQSNVPDPFNFEPNTSTIYGYNIGIEMSSGVMLIYKNRTSYIFNIDISEYESVEAVQIETKFIF